MLSEFLLWFYFTVSVRDCVTFYDESFPYQHFFFPSSVLYSHRNRYTFLTDNLLNGFCERKKSQIGTHKTNIIKLVSKKTHCMNIRLFKN